jgi:DNA primase catalytic subunit
VFSPEHCKKISDAKKGKILSEEHKKKISVGLTGNQHPEGVKQKISETMKGRPCPWYDKVRAAKKAHPIKGPEHHSFGKVRSDETKEKLRLANLGKTHSAETIKKMCEMRKLDKHPNWMGGKSFEPYCPKFNDEFKERVRAYFDYTCPECLTHQNGTALHVHHINFNKMSCCDDTLPLFIPLCTPCHTKTNFNREYWEQYFTDMIDGYYQGKCYFSKEEMVLVD